MISRESACLIKIQCSDMDATAIYRHAKIGKCSSDSGDDCIAVIIRKLITAVYAK